MNSTTIAGSPLTFDELAVEETAILKQMNDDERQRLIPTIVFLVIISILGIFGNGIVCHVYRTKYRLSNSRCFIVCLSTIDLLTCGIAIPFEIFTVIDQYTFTEPWLCKMARFFNTLGTLSSSFLLLVIAIDRHRKVCKPFSWQISSNTAKILCGTSIILSLVLALPAVFIYGKQIFQIDGMTINGTECSTDDKMLGTKYPFINAAFFGTLFITGIFTICILYCFIGAAVKRHAYTMPGQCSTAALRSHDESDKPTEIIYLQDIDEKEKEAKKEAKVTNYKQTKSFLTKTKSQKNVLIHGNSPTRKKDQMVTNNNNTKKESSRSRLSSIRGRISNVIRQGTSVTSNASSVTIRETQDMKQARARKTAFLMFLISLAFIISYFPHLLLIILRQVKEDFVDNMSDSGKAVYKFFLRSFFLNAAINPIIYGVCDTRFRSACKEMLSCCNDKERE